MKQKNLLFNCYTTKLFFVLFFFITISNAQTYTLKLPPPIHNVTLENANYKTQGPFAVWWDKDNPAMEAQADTVLLALLQYRLELLSYDMLELYTIRQGYYMNVYLYQPGVDDFGKPGWQTSGGWASSNAHTTMGLPNQLNVDLSIVRHELFHNYDFESGNFRVEGYSEWTGEAGANWFTELEFPTGASNFTGNTMVTYSNHELWAYHGLYPSVSTRSNYEASRFLYFLTETKGVDKSIIAAGSFNQHANSALHSIYGESNVQYWSRVLGNNGQTFRDYFAEYAARTVNNFDYLTGSNTYDWTSARSLIADFGTEGSNGWVRPADNDATRNTSFNTYRVRNTNGNSRDYEFKIRGDATSTNGIHTSRFMGKVVLKDGGTTTFYDVPMQPGDLQGSLTVTVPDGAEAFLVVVSVPEIIKETGHVFSHEVYIDRAFGNPRIGFDGSSVNEIEDSVCTSKDITVDVLMYNGANINTDVAITINSTTATQGVDFDLITTSITFPASSTTPQPVTIRLYHDFVVDTNEAIELGLNITTGGSNAQVHNSIDTYTINLLDNDDGGFIDVSGPSNMTKVVDVGTCGAVVTYTNPTSVLTCDTGTVISQTAGLASGSVFPIGITMNTFQITNTNGDTKEHSFSVTVNDSESPIVSNSAGNVTVNNDSGQCTAVVNYSIPSFTDNCDIINNPTDVTFIPGFDYLGTHNGHTYFLSNHQVRAQQAFDEAAKYGGHLVTMNSFNENYFLYNELNARGKHSWLGYKNLTNDGNLNSFTWTNGEPTTFTKFATHEYRGNYAYLSHYYTQHWFSAADHESILNHYVLEIDAGITRTAGLASGEAFPVGTTTVTHEYKDLGGNTISSSFDVTVNDAGGLCTVKVAPLVYLQGATLNPNAGEESLMRDDLRIAGIIPTTSPYTDRITCDASVFNTTGTNAIVDWVWIELRDENSNTTILESRSALLQRDGDVVGTDGTSALIFNQLSGNYYVAIKHRNHLGIMSANTIMLGNTTTAIDFSTPSTLTFGANAQASFGISPETMTMWPGNVNGDTIIQYSGTNPDTPDILSVVLNDAGNFLNFPTYILSGYNNHDINMDGNTQYTGTTPDVPFILQNVLAHPGNFLNFSTYQIIEQLPENNQ